MANRLFLTNSQVLTAIESLGNTLTEYYRDRVSEENPLFVIVIAQGAIKFYAELCNTLRLPTTLGLACTRGAWDSPESRRIEFIDFKAVDLKGRHVLVVEDICDSGNTLNLLAELLHHESSALSVKCAVLFRNDAAPVKEFEPDYVCFETGGKYVFGFGLDSHDGLDRNQNSVFYIEQEGDSECNISN